MLCIGVNVNVNVGGRACVECVCGGCVFVEAVMCLWGCMAVCLWGSMGVEFVECVWARSLWCVVFVVVCGTVSLVDWFVVAGVGVGICGCRTLVSLSAESIAWLVCGLVDA